VVVAVVVAEEMDEVQYKRLTHVVVDVVGTVVDVVVIAVDAAGIAVDVVVGIVVVVAAVVVVVVVEVAVVERLVYENIEVAWTVYGDKDA